LLSFIFPQNLLVFVRIQFNRTFMNTLRLPSLLFLLCSLCLSLSAQPPGYWQQQADYYIRVNMDTKRHQYTGYQSIKYTNHSPDTLVRLYYHLYFNAFQPGSSMDVRSRSIPDPDPRVADRIAGLTPDQTGWYKVNRLDMDGEPCRYQVNETILEVLPPNPVPPGATVLLEMDYKAQIPVQIRRSGRDNKEGISYSMTQWYPKLCEYDHQGWHANPYIGREFYGVWGNFKVDITMDAAYVLGASGILTNPEEIGAGYATQNNTEPTNRMPGNRTWRWSANQVHDFAWTADPDYKHTTFKRPDGLTLHFLYQENEKTRETWSALPGIMDEAITFANEHFGRYPYESYAFLQGGDGGMEYPMATLITGERSLSSLVGVSVHELMHAWYYGLLGTNESLYAWMDEGFVEFASVEIMNHLRRKGLVPGKVAPDPHLDAIRSWLLFNASGQEEPLTTHADHFQTNRAYSMAAYVKGHVFLTQLAYIIGEENFRRAMLRYFDTWKFKHPTPNDLLRIMEKESGMELDWFLEYFRHTTKRPDYGIAAVEKANRKETRILLENLGDFPMPLDLTISFRDGTSRRYTIPLDILRGNKTTTMQGNVLEKLPDWRWPLRQYEMLLDIRFRNITRMEIDDSGRLADGDRSNNLWSPEGITTPETGEEEN
jgi:hypothetical protein